MIKECTADFIKELEINAQEGKIEKLIIELKGKKYFADYTLADEAIDLPLSNKLRMVSALKEFRTMLTIDKVNNFSVHYMPKDSICVINHSYKIKEEEITKNLKLDKARNDLKIALSLASEIGISGLALSNVYKKSSKQSINQSINQKQNTNKVRYQEITIEEAINNIIEMMK